jgi:uncharacterized protein DUF695
MALFRRTPKESAADRQRAAINDFWAWWAAEGRSLASASISGAGSTDAFVAAMVPRVHAIDAGLAWELSPGSTSRHRLTVTAAGTPELRAPARRWRASAPPADDEWAFTDTRQPVAEGEGYGRLEIGGREYALADVSVDARVRGVELDVSVHHPHFADLDGPDRDQVAYLLLDQVLGEDAVETWVGEISSSPVRALDPVPIGGLRAVVRDLTAQHTEPDGSPKFALLQGEAPNGRPVLVLARIPMRPATAPHLDTYVGIALPYTDQTPEGLPGPGSLDDLRALEDHVSARIGGSGEVVAVQSHDGLRVLHTYVDGTTPAAEQIRVAVQGWDQGPVQVETRPDPAWSAVRHLRG